MHYDLHITAAAERDLLRAADHIEYILKDPQAANDLLDKVEKQIRSLSVFPEKFRLVEDPVLASWGIRFIIVNGYLAFYTISEEQHLVIIIRFLFQKSSWNAILCQNLSVE